MGPIDSCGPRDGGLVEPPLVGPGSGRNMGLYI